MLVIYVHEIRLQVWFWPFDCDSFDKLLNNSNILLEFLIHLHVLSQHSLIHLSVSIVMP